MSADTLTDVVDFWFGKPSDAEYGLPRKAWFEKDAAFDAEICETFGNLVENVLADPAPPAADDSVSLLGRIIVLDQFTRNIYRGTARAFASDAQVLRLAVHATERGADRQLLPVQRVFVYLPFEHSESIAMQDRSVALFRALVQSHPDLPWLANYLDYAEKHHAVIARFGRFPHRNAILDRPSTPDETAFLSQPGSAF
ncbi:MAG TPA: DUF924 family protein [Burkholderiales bacterium]|nr:DUF924 family protein [Burkholderiales bacterium]